MVGEATLSNKAKGVFIWISLNSSKICFIFSENCLDKCLRSLKWLFCPVANTIFQ